MHRQNGLGPRRHRPFKTGRIQRVGRSVDIDKYRPGTGPADGLRRGNEGHRHRDHFIARTYPQRQQGQPQGVGSAANPHRVPGFAKAGEKRSSKRLTNGPPAKAAASITCSMASANSPLSGAWWACKSRKGTFIRLDHRIAQYALT